MNEELLLNFMKRCTQNSELTYDKFNELFSFLSLKEQYRVSEFLFKNGINLVDDYGDKSLNIEEDDKSDILDTVIFEDFDNDSSFKDYKDNENDYGTLVINKTVRQSNEILCSLIQQGNMQAEQDLCVKNKRLVDKYANSYAKKYSSKLDFDDLEQAGFIGLIKAAHKYDSQQENAFSTYAVFWIKQNITREILNIGYTIRIPVHMMEKVNKVMREDNLLIQEGYTAIERLCKIAQNLEFSIEEVNECLSIKNNCLSYTSLDSPVGDDGNSVLSDFLPDNSVESVEDIVIKKGLRAEIEKVLKELKPREVAVLERRCGLKDGIPRTLEEIGQEFGLTRERIRQIEAKAIKKCRHPSRIKLLIDYGVE